MRDMNARAGNTPIPRIIGKNVCSENGQMLSDFLTFIKLKIINGFLEYELETSNYVKQLRCRKKNILIKSIYQTRG